MFKPWVKLSLLSVLTLVISGVLFWQGLQNEFDKQPTQVLGQASSLPSINKPTYRVSRVVDGDTIEVTIDNKPVKVRLIGVNTPETVDPRRPVQCFGKEASAETKRLLNGKDVVMENDVSDTDSFGRLLRYVYIPLQDGTNLFVNDYLVRQGFASLDTVPPDVRYSSRFAEAQKEARDNNRGLWAACNGQI
jgi:micrococcal nuclease